MMGKRLNSQASGLDELRDTPETEQDEKAQKELRELFEEDVFGSDDDYEEEKEDAKDKGKDDISNKLDEDLGEFDGLDSEEEKPENNEDPIVAEMSRMTEQDFQKLSKENPTKALEMIVTHILHKRGVGEHTPDSMLRAATHATSVQNVRKVIAARYQPHKNTKLREKAQ